jgi:Bacterial antitoxin of type II TA system, VapB
MASHMKTTVHIPDALLAEAQAIAARDKTTLKELVSEGLRKVVEERAVAKPFKLKDCSFPPPGTVPEKTMPKDWSEIVTLVYGDRGG